MSDFMSPLTRTLILSALASYVNFAGPAAVAAPPSQLSILRACGESDTAAQCERVVEADQIRQYPAVASRDGRVLRLKKRNGQSLELRDEGTPGSDEGPKSKFFAFWDYWTEPHAAVVSVSAEAGDYYLIVDLDRGTQTRITAEPMLSPDSGHFVVPDLCETQCGNAIELWRFDRDRIVRERTFRPSEKWYEADVRWKDPTTLEIEYSVAAPGQQASADAPPTLVRSARPLFLRITDRAWTVDENAR